MRALKKYKNIIDAVNIYQLTGDARQGKATMVANINRIVEFYYYTVPSLSSQDLHLLKGLLNQFYKTSTFYQERFGFADFIVPEFSVVSNQEWVTVNQFIAFLQYNSVSDKLNTVNTKYKIHRLIRASKSIKDVYYAHHRHSTVDKADFDRIIAEDF